MGQRRTTSIFNDRNALNIPMVYRVLSEFSGFDPVMTTLC